MRHFLFEFITGGGLSDQPLSETLIGEGEIMVQTLLTELSELEDSTILVSRDSRLAMSENGIRQYIIERKIEQELPELIKASDVSWLIAPETDGCLEEYAKLFIKHGKLFIGSSPEAIKVATSKRLTNKKLAAAGINVVETRLLSEKRPNSESAWVVKPDDGVGGEGAFIINDGKSLDKILQEESTKNLIMQPYIEGEHMSMSLLVFDGDVCLLACNKQYIDIKNGLIKLKAIGVNECLSFKDEMLELAKKIISVIPGFAGYIGVDLIAVEDGLRVLEINPRFTTAYAGISESIGCNVTIKILDTFLNKKIPDIDLITAKLVKIKVY